MNRKSESVFKILFIAFLFCLFLFVLLAFRSCQSLSEVVEDLKAERTADLNLMRPSR